MKQKKMGTRCRFSLLFLLFLIGATAMEAQNVNYDNVSIGNSGPAYGVKIKNNFPGFTGGFAREFALTDGTGSTPYIALGSYGSTTNGVNTLNYSYIGKDYAAPYMSFATNGDINIRYRLTVYGTILTSRVKVAVPSSANWNWADYVFDKGYKLKSLPEVEAYIKANKHLEGMPTTEDVKRDGLDIAPVTAKLLEKIEELTLHMIEMKKVTDRLQEENSGMKAKILKLEGNKKK